MTDREFTEEAEKLVKLWLPKRIAVDAVQWDGSTLAIEALNSVLDLEPTIIVHDGEIRLSTAFGVASVCIGDYIVKDAFGKFYAMKAEDFEKLFDVVTGIV